MFLWISSNSCALNLLLVRSHQAEIFIVKRLIQGRNSVTRMRVEPRSFDQGRRKNAFTLPATQPTVRILNVDFSRSLQGCDDSLLQSNAKKVLSYEARANQSLHVTKRSSLTYKILFIGTVLLQLGTFSHDLAIWHCLHDSAIRNFLEGLSNLAFFNDLAILHFFA